MLKVILIEKSYAAALHLELLLFEIDNNIKFLQNTIDVDSAIMYLRKNSSDSPDIIFINLHNHLPDDPKIMELINLDGFDFKIVFISTDKTHAMRAFRINALDYLVEPFDKDRLEQALEKITESRGLKLSNPLLEKRLSAHNDFKKIIIETNQNWNVFAVDDILYIQANSNKVYIFLKNGHQEIIEKKISEIEQLVMRYPTFFRCHKSYIVNLKHVKKLVKSNGTLVLEGDKTIFCSENKYLYVIQHLGNSVPG